MNQFNNKPTLPHWLQVTPNYKVTYQHSHHFLSRNLIKLSQILTQFNHHNQIKQQVTVADFFVLLLEIICLSLTSSLLFIWLILIVNLYRVVLQPRQQIIRIFKHAAISFITISLIILPSVLLNPKLFSLLFIVKTIVIAFVLVVQIVKLNFINFIQLLQQLHFPEILLFIVDIMIRYLKVLGVFMVDNIQAISLRSVGRDPHAYTTVGHIFGSLYLKSVALSREIYLAMVARGFTGSYKHSRRRSVHRNVQLALIKSVILIGAFFLIKG